MDEIRFDYDAIAKRTAERVLALRISPDGTTLHTLVKGYTSGNLIPVVRCKDCVHRPDQNGHSRIGHCPYVYHDMFSQKWEPDDEWYCPCGEAEGDILKV